MPLSREQLRHFLSCEIHRLAEDIFDAEVEKPMVVSAASVRHKIALKFGMHRGNVLQLHSSTRVTQEQIREVLADRIYGILKRLYDSELEEPIVVSATTDRHNVALKFAMRRRRNVSLSLVSAPMSAEMSGQKAPDMSGLSPDMSGMSPDMSGEKVHLAPDTPDPLSTMQREILEAVSGDAMRAKEIADRAGYRLNSHFRGTLSRLVNRGYLQRTLAGYVQTCNQSAADLDRSA